MGIVNVMRNEARGVLVKYQSISAFRGGGVKSVGILK